jgi:PRC-barrel domain.
MSAREIRLHHLVGRKVRDTTGKVVGRIHELCVEIELNQHGNDYVVREFRLGSMGPFEFLGGSYFIRELLHTLRVVKADALVVPWRDLDLSDPERPVLLASWR